jgi:cytochrome c biogenesis protein
MARSKGDIDGKNNKDRKAGKSRKKGSNKLAENLGIKHYAINPKLRAFRFLYSMRSGMVMLALIALLSILGTVIPQGGTPEFYAHSYNGLALKAIQGLHLDRVYTSWWFAALVFLLSINLILCNFRRLPGLLRQWRRPLTPEAVEPQKGVFYKRHPSSGNAVADAALLKDFFERAGFRHYEVKETEQGTYLYAQRTKAGVLGSWLSHLGLLLIIIFFFLGKLFGFEAFVYGVPGTDQNIEGTPYSIAIDAFDIEYRQDYSVHQYITDLTLIEPGGSLNVSGRTQVNAPFRAQGLSVYQNGTGWALEVVMKKGDGTESSQLLYPSEIFEVEGEGVALHYLAFYPDFVLRDGQPYTATPFLNRPVMVYSLYEEGRQVRTGVSAPGEPIPIGGDVFTFYAPQLFTVLQVVRDPGTIPVAIGGGLLLMGLFLSFYWVPKSLYGFVDPLGELWISGFTEKNPMLYHEALAEVWASLKVGD